jgi:hypothetical protein
MVQRSVLIREPKVNRLVAANPLKSNPHSFRSRISATRAIFQTPTSAAEQ